MVAWSHGRIGFVSIFKFVAQNMESSWKTRRGRQIKLGAATLCPFPYLPLPRESPLWAEDEASLDLSKKVCLMKGLNEGLCQVFKPGTTLPLIAYMPVGNAAKPAQRLSDFPVPRASQGPCSEPGLPAQERVWSWVSNGSADTTRNARKQFLV